MTHIEDQHFINQVLKGNTNSYAALIDRYKDMVFSLALKMLGNREEAEEIAQDAFIKAFNSLSKFKGDSKFSSWLYRITYNCCLDTLKKSKKQQKVQHIEDFNEHQAKELESIFEAIDDKEKNIAVQECIKELESDEAFLITLYYFDNQSIEEISGIMNMSSANTKVKLFRTRKKLATILQKRISPEIIDYYISN